MKNLEDLGREAHKLYRFAISGLGGISLLERRARTFSCWFRVFLVNFVSGNRSVPGLLCTCQRFISYIFSMFRPLSLEFRSSQAMSCHHARKLHFIEETHQGERRVRCPVETSEYKPKRLRDEGSYRTT